MKRTFIAIAAVLAASALSGCGGDANGKAKDDKAETAPIPVEVREPQLGEMVAVYSGTATLEADEEAVVVAKVGGEVKRILVEEGQNVRAGQVLAVLDGDQLRLQLAQSAANLRKLERDYQRNSDLYAKGLIASNAVDNVKSDLDALRASNDIAVLPAGVSTSVATCRLSSRKPGWLSRTSVLLPAAVMRKRQVPLATLTAPPRLPTATPLNTGTASARLSSAAVR